MKILVVSHYKDGRGTPLSSLWFSSTQLKQKGITLHFAHTKNPLAIFQILKYKHVIFDGAFSMRRGFGIILYLIAQIMRKQVCVFWHEMEWEINRALVFRDLRRTLRLQLPYAVRHALSSPKLFHLHVSQAGRTFLIDRHGIQPDRIAVVHVCIDPAVADSFTPPLDHTPGRFVLAGPVNVRKGIDMLLTIAQEVCRQRPEAQFVWMGDMPASPAEKRRLLDQRRDMGLDNCLTFTGRVPSPYATMAEAEAILLTSRDEPFAKVLVEALALGKRAVAFDVGGNREVVGDLGTIVPQEEVDAFVACLVRPDENTCSPDMQGRRRQRFEDMLRVEAFTERFKAAMTQWTTLGTASGRKRSSS